jgi:hypothetical protein
MAVAVLIGSVWLGGPPVASGLVTAGLAVTGFSAASTNVAVDADPPLELLGGHADRVRIVATDARFGTLRADSVDLTLSDVDLFAPTAERIDGLLEGVVLEAGAGPIPVTSVEIGGAGDAAPATIRMRAAAFEALAEQSLAGALGQVPTDVRLAAPDRLTLTIAGVSTSAELGVSSDGALSATGGPFLGGPVVLVEPSGMDPFRLAGVSVEGSTLVLSGTVAVADLLR